MPIPINHNIIRLQIPIYDIPLMQLLQRQQYLRRIILRNRLIKIILFI